MHRLTPAAAGAVLAAVLLTGCTSTAPADTRHTTPAPAPASGSESLVRPASAQSPFPVVHVSDGDTILVRRHSAVVSVRLIGVDTPETKRPNTPVQCFGPQASAFTTRTVSGRSVWLESDPVAGARDRYGRTLAYVWLEDGSLLDLELIEQGFGRQYDYHDQPYTYRRQFQAAEAGARAHRSGLWGTCPTDR
ncbi:thermonuclease family protein [Gordonia sp. N1V]|uniref:thermonuclease family protein n=1 Tax=Gordonia sp. N1V TaxID=3034163 RepID=UPI0023E1A34C|nr:thermonuclease family protein [Gordonia sp. N1V]MDF3284991.1 thermonuclease family protein [Gordonia sp. N1V]